MQMCEHVSMDMVCGNDHSIPAAPTRNAASSASDERTASPGPSNNHACIKDNLVGTHPQRSQLRLGGAYRLLGLELRSSCLMLSGTEHLGGLERGGLGRVVS